jgi:hypothetical protein
MIFIVFAGFLSNGWLSKMHKHSFFVIINEVNLFLTGKFYE